MRIWSYPRSQATPLTRNEANMELCGTPLSREFYVGGGGGETVTHACKSLRGSGGMPPPPPPRKVRILTF